MATSVDRLVRVPVGRRWLDGNLGVPDPARGVVLFAHGSGSGRFSPRNQYVASTLREAGMATFLLDLLTEEEAQDRAKVFDIDLLAERLHAASNWLEREGTTSNLKQGLFGASTGGGAALVAAARHPEQVAAVVSRGGRPDLAGAFLPLVQAPTLLLVGGQDDVVIQLNRQALEQLTCPKKMVIVPGATHLFSEPGTLETVAELAREWFASYLQ